MIPRPRPRRSSRDGSIREIWLSGCLVAKCTFWIAGRISVSVQQRRRIVRLLTGIGPVFCFCSALPPTVISGGENVSSLMVEQELASHPSVLECVLVARPHPKWGERGHAFIVLTDQARQEYPVNDEAKVRQLEEEIRKYAKSRMSGFAVPEWVQVVQELPKTSTGSECGDWLAKGTRILC